LDAGLRVAGVDYLSSSVKNVSPLNDGPITVPVAISLPFLIAPVYFPFPKRTRWSLSFKESDPSTVPFSTKLKTISPSMSWYSPSISIYDSENEGSQAFPRRRPSLACVTRII